MPRLNIAEIRKELDRSSGAEYWRSLEQLAGKPEFTEFLHHEFPRLASIWEAPVDRRRVLKLMAASMALGGLTACRMTPAEKIVPYVTMPEHLVPGVPQHYASSLELNGFARGVVVESREGRPIKVEGNPAHPGSLGATDALAQAAILSLYEPERARGVQRLGALSTYRDFLAAMAERRRRWRAGRGRGLAVLTETTTSPSTNAALQGWLAGLPEARLFHHDAVDRSVVYQGANMAFGQALEPVYQFENARRVLALDADFMGVEQPGHLAWARNFTARRNPDKGKMARLYAVESTPTITGASADHCQPLRRDEIETFTRALARALGLQAPGPDAPVPKTWFKALVDDLKQHRREALVVPGITQSAAVHALAHAINHRLQAFARTLAFTPPLAQPAGGDLRDLVQAIQGGGVTDLVILTANPVYTAPAELEFTRALEQVNLRIHFGQPDETAAFAHWHVPEAHPLETWGDARAHDGTVSLIQPLIEPLHNGRTTLEFLAALSPNPVQSARDLLRAYWQSQYGGAEFERFWKQSLKQGLISGSAPRAFKPGLKPGLAGRLPRPQRADKDQLIAQFRPDYSVFDGRFANNGWLQELPRPLTKLTWDNAAMIAPATAEQHGLNTGDVVRLKAGEYALNAPVMVLPGMPAGAVSLHLGYGRVRAGRIADGVGVSAYRLRHSRTPWATRGVSIRRIEGEHEFATTQHHHSPEGRGLYRKATLEEFMRNPDFVKEQGYDPPRDESLYPEPEPPGTPDKWPYAWGMAIDLNACIGCEACVIACQAENNIPIVGKEEVQRGHEMHWLRIDRYYTGNIDIPETVFQPVPCMHCENAPCEYVCPVEATQHSPTGLNEMIYNRCIGTRYCSQNCPYKVRRFNWFEYARQEIATPPPAYNPEVTVRPRGVMEKCTYCVQRISRARIQAELRGGRIRDDELVTACQQVCPTEAIVFGDINDSRSEVSKWKEKSRNYAMLAELNTRPRTTYLGAVTNPNPKIGKEKG